MTRPNPEPQFQPHDSLAMLLEGWRHQAHLYRALFEALGGTALQEYEKVLSLVEEAEQRAIAAALAAGSSVYPVQP